MQKNSRIGLLGLFGYILLGLDLVRVAALWLLEWPPIRTFLEMANLGQAVDFILDHWSHPGWMGNPFAQLLIIVVGFALIIWDAKRPKSGHGLSALFPSFKVSNRQMIIGGFSIVLLGLIVAAIGIWQQSSTTPSQQTEQQIAPETRLEITTLFNSTIRPAADAENNVLQRVLALMARHPDKNVDAFIGLVQRSVIDEERAAFSNLNNAMNNLENIDLVDFQERLGAYYREYQVGRTYIAKGREIGIDLSSYAMFDEWRRLDRSMLDSLRQFSAAPRYNLLRNKIEGVGWGEGVTASLNGAGSVISPVQPATPQTPIIPDGSAASDINRRLLEIADLQKYFETIQGIQREGDALRSDNIMRQISSSSSNVSSVTARIVRLRDRAIAAASRESQIYQKYQFPDIENEIHSAPDIGNPCNYLISLLNDLRAPIDLKADIYDQPAYQLFSDTIDEIGAWLEEKNLKLKSMREQYERAQANAK